MEENVALDTSKQKQFVKSIKGIKKLIKKSEADVPEDVVPKVQDKKKSKKKRPERGLVYLSHIPHGFYEHEMTQYFKQFGAVSNVRVIRSKRTGNSKGFAFVEFKQPAVAEIVADTMNNYLMGKRLIKAAFVPPEKQRPKAMRKHWSRFNNPGRTARLTQKKAYNENKDSAGELARARKTFSTYKKNMRRLSDIGINYDFFTPVDIPEGLEQNKDSKKDTVQNKDNKQKKDKLKTVPASNETTKEQKKVNPKKEKKSKAPEPVVNKKEQKEKHKKLKDAGVQPVENFMKIQEEEDSDSSADFDSDDYSKMLENDSDMESGDEGSEEEAEQDDGSDEFEITGSDDDDSEVDESEDEEVIPPPKKGKGKLGPIPPPVQSKKQAKQTEKFQQPKSKSSEQKGQKAKRIEKAPVQQKVPTLPEQGKRKAPQKNAGSPKKPKFEKQTQPMKKQFKKKK